MSTLEKLCHVCISIYICICSYKYMCVYYMYVYTYSSLVSLYIFVCIESRICFFSVDIHNCLCACIHVIIYVLVDILVLKNISHAHTPSLFLSLSLALFVFVCMRVCVRDTTSRLFLRFDLLLNLKSSLRRRVDSVPFSIIQHSISPNLPFYARVYIYIIHIYINIWVCARDVCFFPVDIVVCVRAYMQSYMFL